MENTERGDTSEPGDPSSDIKRPAKQEKNKDAGNAEKVDTKNSIQAQQEKFISDTEETENLIDPGNEHHHHANEVDKNID